MSDLNTLLHGIDTIIGQEQLEEKLKTGRKLKIKLGVDPTRPDLTFGHLVVFNKLRQFQQMGHEAILIIGDYTAMIGDPSGRSSTRPVLTAEDIKINSETYLEQAYKILDKDKTTIVYNSHWFGKMSFADCLNLTRKMTVARMLERDDFSKRYNSNTPISIVEFLYPLIQGYDSLYLKSDVELGGSDQLFNMLVGRTLQKDAGDSEQVVITMPLLVGLDGEKKMSKSYDNYISFNDSPKDMFGKIMSVSDNGMWEYYRLLLNKTDAEIKELQTRHPMECKKELAVALTSEFHSPEAGQYERGQFEQVFSKNKLPDDMPVYKYSDLISAIDPLTVLNFLDHTGSFPSKGEIKRLVKQGGVKMNQEKCDDENAAIPDLEEVVLQAGKRKFFKIVK
jgi:tyrosyl-tRNA synthetase